jgi:hypothetical protein
MSVSRPGSPKASPPLLDAEAEDKEYFVVGLSHEQLQKHAQEIAALNESHANAIAELKQLHEDEIVGLKACREEKSENEILLYSGHFHDVDSAAAKAKLEQDFKDLQSKFDQLKTEHDALKAKLAAAESKNNTNKPFSGFSRLGLYNPMFYPFNNNFQAFNAARNGAGILPLQQQQPAQEQPLVDKVLQPSPSSAPLSPR